MNIDKTKIMNVFHHSVAQFPGKTAVEGPDRYLTYRDLDLRVTRLAALFGQLQLGSGRTVMTLMNADTRLIVALLGILESGAIYMPADKDLPERLLGQMLTEGAPDAIVTTPALQDTVQTLLQKHGHSVAWLIVIDEDINFHPAALGELKTPDNPPLPEDSCYVFYTSGSTGKAKAILGSQKGLSHFIHWEIGEFGLNSDCRVSQLSQFTFDASLRDIFIPLCTGGTLCLPPADIRTNIPALISWLNRSRITLVHCTPPVFRLITRFAPDADGDEKPQAFPWLKYILMAGEPLYGRDIEAWRNKTGEMAELVNLYGTSETTMAKTFHRIKDIPADGAQPLHVGRPISNTAIAVLNGNKLCSPGEIGEIYIKTPFRSHGYLRDEALSNSVFVQNPLVKDRPDIMHRTGDMGRYNNDGNIEVIGRLDDQVKVNGIRLELGQVRQAVLAAKEIRDAVVVTIPGGSDDTRLACYYVSNTCRQEELRTHLREYLLPGLIPAFFIRMDELPLTINGKVDKRALPQPVSLPATTADTPESDDDEVLSTMKRIWSEVLGIAQPHSGTMFFHAGGTSLRAILVISRLYKEYGIQLKIKDIFDHPSLGGLCDHIRQLQQKAVESIRLVPQSDTYESSFIQKGIWLQLQQGSGHSSYNMTGAYEFRGRIDLDAFQQTIAFLVERYEVLRTSFVVDKGELRQRIHPFDRNKLNITVEDAASGAPLNIAATAERESQYAFDPLEETLVRWRIIQWQDDHFGLVVTQHHLIADGWSIDILMKEFLHILNAVRNNTRPALPSLKIQYKDYASWHNRYVLSNNGRNHLAYWRTQLEGPLRPLNLLSGTTRGRARAHEGRLFTFELPKTQAAAVFALTEANGKSIFSFLLAVTNILLHHCSGQEDILVGSPFAGRNHPDLESQLGLFVNILVLRNNIRPGQPFLEFLDEVAANALRAYEHGVYPLEKTIEELDLTAGEPGLNFLNVFVQMQTAHEAALAAANDQSSDLRIRPADFRHLTSKFDLTFNFSAHRETDHISVAMEYATAFFSERELMKMRREMEMLIDGILRDAESTIASLTTALPIEKNLEIKGITERIHAGITRNY